MANFTDYNLKETTYKFIEVNNFKVASEIQSAVIPLALKGKDIIGISQTGTGKTHAFLIPIIERINPDNHNVQAVITAPTRELALQIYNRLSLINDIDNEISIRLIIGGEEKSKTNQSLKQQPQIIVGTPGRMRDLFLNDKTLRLDTASIMIIDEADMTMEYGFLEDIDQIVSRMGKVQILSFSATMPKQLDQFLHKYMHQPKLIRIEDDALFKPRVEHILVPCRHIPYEEMLMRLLRCFDPYLCLIFANTREEASQIAQKMRDAGYDLIEIHGDLSTRERKTAMKKLEGGKQRYIVASDIASRGMDIEGVSHVISVGFPKELDFYIHRSGRTGRAGHDGICYALYNKSDENAIKALQKKGIHFDHKKVGGTNLFDLKPIFAKRKHNGDTEMDIAISKIVNNKKNKKVKPGYKKKRKDEVEKLKRKAKRSLIQSEIKKQSKEKNKEKQRAKYKQD